MNKSLVIAALPLMLCATACGHPSAQRAKDPAAAFASGDLPGAEAGIQDALAKAPDNHDLLMLGGRIALENGDYERAKARFLKLLDVQPPVPLARVYMAKAQLLSSGGQAALATLKATPLDSGEAFAVFAAANFSIGKGNDAVQAIETGLVKFPDSPDLLALKGEVSLALGDLTAAKQMADRALKGTPGHIDAALLTAHVALAEHRAKDASHILEGVLKTRPDNVSALISLASIRHDQGDKKAAEEMFARAASRFDGRSIHARYYLAQMAFDAGDTAKAEKLVHGIDRSAVPPAEMLKGLIAAKRNQPQQAIASLRYYLSHGQEDARARILLAGLQAKVGDSAAAWETLSPLANAANASPTLLNLAASLTEDLRLPEAASFRARATAAAGGDPDAAQMASADKAMQNGEWAKADAIYTQLIGRTSSADNVIALNNAALAKLELGDLPGAQALARRARALAPNDAIVADTLGWILFRTSGPTDEAVRLMQSALNAQPNNSEIRTHAMTISRALKISR